jgi:hypothetical protein
MDDCRSAVLRAGNNVGESYFCMGRGLFFTERILTRLSLFKATPFDLLEGFAH